MASTSDISNVRVAHVSFLPGASHLTLQLCLHDDRKVFFRPISEKLDRVRYRLQLLASNVSTQKKRRKNGVKDSVAPTVSVKFYDNYDQEMNEKVLKVGDALMRAKRLEIGEEIFVVLHNQPIVTSLKVLEPVMAGIGVYPLPKTEFCTAEECSWQWFRLDKEDETSQTLVSTERRYMPTEDEIGCRFCVKCQAPTMKSEFAQDSNTEVVTMPVESGPNRDVFKERRRMGAISAAEKYPDAVDAFRVMSYNVLYDGYATTEHAQKNLFSYVDASVMKETRRIQLILQEIEENNSDIVCLQEMGETVYKSFFEPMLTLIGYCGFYSGKTGTTNEGCATFFRTARFNVAEEVAVNLATVVKNSTNPASQHLMQAFPEIAKGINRIPSIAQILVLRSKVDPARVIILSNTHLFYRGDAHLIRLLQGAAVVECISKRKAAPGFENAAIVMCGDWNAHPRTALIAFLLDGQIDSSHSHWQQAPSFQWNVSQVDENDVNKRVANAAQVHSDRFEHDLQLVSACGIPAFTNYVMTFVDTLDYILVGSKVLQVRDTFPLFTEEEATHELALPSSTFPSDHVSLVCDLSW
ncbi:unnamed protein product [Peronospora farinosa]|uniref:Endonuclease/exonuclease/phosphatase domain-containing protein n=1 Tax=Peronospora farinosa TaxID=134698 RepID=A0AAV0T4N0_9STRA|nr:unnamed protein product [Peronospora farinosa]CAI5712601.1 unnamed protein product [Peronospora farinosa]